MKARQIVHGSLLDANTFTIKSSPSTTTTKSMAIKSGERYAVNFVGDRLAFPKNIIWSESMVSYGKILAAVTSEGAPCAILLHPAGTKGVKDCGKTLQIDLKKRFPGSNLISSNEKGTNISLEVRDMLTRLADFVKSHDEVKSSTLLASRFEKEAKDLQQHSVLFGTAFQHSVWRGMVQIPVGRVCTYSQLAEKAGQNTKATRAVAQACGSNPLTFLFPCHRIVAQGGGLGGYHWGIETKQAILEDEKRIAEAAKGELALRPVKRMKLLHV